VAAGRCNEQYFVEMRYKTQRSKRWKMCKRNIWLSDKVIMRVVKEPILRVLEILILPSASVIDYFKLIRLPLPEDENGRR